MSPGESCTLEDGDSIRFGKCVLWHSKTHELAPHGHVRGYCFCYTFHSFVSRNPPGLSASDEQLREQLTVLERTRADIIEERARLDKKLEELDRESHQMCVHVLMRITRLSNNYLQYSIPARHPSDQAGQYIRQSSTPLRTSG
ncbi:hypothetical protein PENSPDRAFT_210268 [Peniophora sp. CONT]|nr:hypothetical protein PENSPDRAFT_210268 [Peniophora sp. CONT]